MSLVFLLNRRTLITYPDLATLSFPAYDPNNNLLTMIDARGITTRYQYDVLNRQIERTFTTPGDATLSRHIENVSSRYDGNNNPIMSTERYSDASTNVSTQRFDDFDRLEAKTDAYGRTLNYGYDLNGNRERLTDPDNLTTSYLFDALNRVTSVTNQQGTTAYAYDRSSLLKSIDYPNNTSASYTYDNALRTISIDNGLGVGAIISRFDYVYDTNGNRVRQTEENGTSPEVTTYTYDLLDRLETVSYPDNITTYTYDAAYNRDSETVTSVDGLTTLKDLDHIYNARNQLTDIIDLLDANQNVTYRFDGNGNQTQKTKSD